MQDYVGRMPKIFAVSALLTPTTVEEALSSGEKEQWMAAMKTELQALAKNRTWQLVDPPRHVKPLSCKWVLSRKCDEKGSVIRHKARLVVCGNMQRRGIDFLDVYAPVVRYDTVRFILALVVKFDMECRHVDFVTAFLNGDMTEHKLVMKQPKCFNDGTGRVCALRKSLYGLRQAPRVWHNALHAYMVAIGFIRLHMDVGLYYRKVGGVAVYVTVYVDDLLIAAAQNKTIDEVVCELRAKFELKDLGAVRHLLAMEVRRVPSKLIALTQTAYIDKVLEKFGMKNSKTVLTPQVVAKAKTQTEPGSTSIKSCDIPYREIVGSLQYLVRCTRPDLANAVRELSKHLESYSDEHYTMAKRCDTCAAHARMASCS